MYERNDRRDDAAVSGRSGPSPSVIGAIVIAILAVIFVVQNREETLVTFLFWERRADVWVAILVALVLGILLGKLLDVLWRRRRRG